MMTRLNISSKNKTAREEKVVSIVKELVKKYTFPIFTQNIAVESGVRASAKLNDDFEPSVTLNTRTEDPLIILATLIHEQLHWYLDEHPRYSEILEFLKKKYPKQSDEMDQNSAPNSYWNHIAVCFNTRRILKNILQEQDIEHIYTTNKIYPSMEGFVEEHYKEIEEDLKKYNTLVPL